jgi:hypothetical protein
VARRKAGRTELRTVDDLAKAAVSLSEHFGTDVVYVIGSQAVLLTDQHASDELRTSAEIDAWPANNREWEARHRSEASEEINALFGWESNFHSTYGFYVDGVDETTASLPPDWRDRARSKTFQAAHRSVTVIAPGMDDIVVSKLHRLEEKDRSYIAAWHRDHPLNFDRIKALMTSCHAEPAIERRAVAFLDLLASGA